jgi:hypothetical protein
MNSILKIFFRQTHQSTNLVSDTLERFYLIFDTLGRLVMDIEQFEIK